MKKLFLCSLFLLSTTIKTVKENIKIPEHLKDEVTFFSGLINGIEEEFEYIQEKLPSDKIEEETANQLFSEQYIPLTDGTKEIAEGSFLPIVKQISGITDPTLCNHIKIKIAHYIECLLQPDALELGRSHGKIAMINLYLNKELAKLTPEVIRLLAYKECGDISFAKLKKTVKQK